MKTVTELAQQIADQELGACCALMDDWGLDAADLRAARRPVQPSLKEQALRVLENVATYEPMGYAKPDNRLSEKDCYIIRAALEQLPEDPAVTPAADARGPGSVTEQASPAATPDPAPTADSPVATDEELEKTYEAAGGEPFDFPDALRAVYDLGRLHESLHQRILNGRALQVAAEFAEEYRDDLKALADSDPAPTADGRKPLWE